MVRTIRLNGEHIQIPKSESVVNEVSDAALEGYYKYQEQTWYCTSCNNFSKPDFGRHKDEFFDHVRECIRTKHEE